jgi:hypothetical protein
MKDFILKLLGALLVGCSMMGFIHMVVQIANFAMADRYECLCTEYRDKCECNE